MSRVLVVMGAWFPSISVFVSGTMNAEEDDVAGRRNLTQRMDDVVVVEVGVCSLGRCHHKEGDLGGEEVEAAVADGAAAAERHRKE
jgi:hypothetical protein